MRRLANEVGFDLDAGHCVAYGRLGSDTPGLGAQAQMQTLERLIRQTLPGSLCDVQMHGVRVVVPLLGRDTRLVAEMLDVTLSTRPGPNIGLVGVSDPVETADRHWDALQEAILASRLCSILGSSSERLAARRHDLVRTPPGTIGRRRSMAISDAGPERFLLPLVDAAPPGLLEQRLLGLHFQDIADGTDLFETVEAFVELGCRPTAAARQLALHRNSLASRLNATSRVLEQPIDNTNRLMLEIANKLVRLRRAG